ncbi:hypothetical protein DASB73_030250 [Starmerella bacillaris]|uniref:Uncharacterized protein n=1 Tax=Starmerella bacillaris TaxID=1247836 RepID=A0AAV5RLT0_STABA|nr:hypothetical protein DASB73_030250 [Starmerella bacillaris]
MRTKFRAPSDTAGVKKNTTIRKTTKPVAFKASTPHEPKKHIIPPLNSFAPQCPQSSTASPTHSNILIRAQKPKTVFAPANNTPEVKPKPKTTPKPLTETNIQFSVSKAVPRNMPESSLPRKYTPSSLSGLISTATLELQTTVNHHPSSIPVKDCVCFNDNLLLDYENEGKVILNPNKLDPKLARVYHLVANVYVLCE